MFALLFGKNRAKVKVHVISLKVLRLAILITVFGHFGFQECRGVVSAQSGEQNHSAAANNTLIDELSVSPIVLENDRVRVLHINVGAYGKRQIKHEGGYIIMLADFPFEVVIPLVASPIKSQLRAGEIIWVCAGDYPVENPTNVLLEFLSVEVKDRPPQIPR